MYRPSLEKRTSEIEEMISEKKDRDEGSSSCSNSRKVLMCYRSEGDVLTLGMLVTQGTLSHICKLNGALGACIHEPIAALRMELSSRDDFSQLFHIGWLDVDDIEALILDVQIPQIDAQVITANECLAIAVDRYAVDMISMCIGISPSRNGSNDSIMMGESRQLQLRGVLEFRRSGCASSSYWTGWGQLMR